MRLLIILLFFLSSMLLNAKGNVELYDSYALFKEAVKMGDYELLTDYLTVENTKFLKNNGGVGNFNEVYPFLLSLPFSIEKEINSYQLIKGYKGCLTINGLDESAEPTAINIEYKKESSLWKLDYIHVEYLSSNDEFSKKATCPQRYDS
ncbi:hypothetical protein [Photobacterium sanguinicancri]|uniref:hypothetical protein n=1 Tax=Photobacterium sanguinicancri TaxID=875932 RepID=UPI0021C255C4|nr:hypothetical protein [Photobacterium sanguinicancri]